MRTITKQRVKELENDPRVVRIKQLLADALERRAIDKYPTFFLNGGGVRLITAEGPLERNELFVEVYREGALDDLSKAQPVCELDFLSFVHWLIGQEPELIRDLAQIQLDSRDE